MSGLLSPVFEFQRRLGGDQCRPWMRTPGVRIDMHCHSTFSDERIRWLPGLVFHPMLEPEQVYDLAKARGMDFVTITDHDTIDGCKALIDRRGELSDFIFGEEVTVRFPEDRTVIHVNVYDIDEQQHHEIQRLRDNIYDVVDYVESIGKLCVLNHMTWTSQHRALKSWQIRAMIERFSVFEGLNGTRSHAHNTFTWHATQGHDKVLVGGSDSHTNRVGTTYTLTAGSTAAELIRNIREGNAAPCGAFGTPEQLRDDVWLTLQTNVERHVLDATSAWKRMACRAVGQIGRRLYPLACLGYHARQNLLIRRSLEAIPMSLTPA